MPIGTPDRDVTDIESLQLPAAIVQPLLDRIPTLARSAHDMLAPILENRDHVRRRLLDDGLILAIGDRNAGTRVAAVDGANVTQSFYMGDLVSAVAVVAEGMHAHPNPPAAQSADWSEFVRHDADMDRLGKAVRAALELHLLAQLDHDIVLIDGSHITFIIAINGVLSSTSTTAHDLFARVAREVDLVSAVETVFDDVRGSHIVGSPKSDSSTRFVEIVEDRYGRLLGGNDKLAATLLLDEGEMLIPFRVNDDWERLHIVANQEFAADHIVDLARRLDRAISPARYIAQHSGRGIGLTYARPEGSSTALKVEFKRSRGREYGPLLARSLANETHPPFIMEPFAQFMADGWARSISDIVRAQQDGMIHAFPLDRQSSGAIEYLFRRHRTGL